MNNTITPPKNKPLNVWTRFKPSSTDPMLYDLAVHHITMRSVLASLVSVYKNGEIAPQIAERWNASDDKKEWRFRIDKNWTFENGEIVTARIVLRNFKRILLLKNIQSSESGFLEFLSGAKELNNINKEIEGLSVTDNEIIFKFIKPMPDLLEKISFGLYSIAHPSDYSEDGKWKNGHSVIASGAYRIKAWDNNNLILALRDDLYINKKEDKKIEEVVFNFSSDPKEIIESDIMIRERLNPYAEPSLWTYHSTAQDNNIAYIKVMKWDEPGSLLSNQKVRENLRDIYYDSLADEGLSVTTSFFPLSVKGVQPFAYKKNSSFNYNGKDFSTQPFFTNPNPGHRKELGDIYSNAFKNFTKKIHAVGKNVNYPEVEDDEKKVFDIQFLTTGVLIDSPRDDIKFMFMSKQGIKLPDETGEILKLLKDDNFDVQAVNKLLWEQAVIWPIRHFSMGFWTKNSKNIDVTNLNLMLHPIDFQFVKWR